MAKLDVPDLLYRIDTARMYPPFLERVNGMLNACAARGQLYVATSGGRTYEQQDELYARGRTAPGRKVTNARGGYSTHNFWIAIDFCPDADGRNDNRLEPDYDTPGVYDILGEEAKRVNLEWGGTWVKPAPFDTPHIQLPIKRRGITMAALRKWYEAGGMVEVFRELDRRGPW